MLIIGIWFASVASAALAIFLIRLIEVRLAGDSDPANSFLYYDDPAAPKPLTVIVGCGFFGVGGFVLLFTLVFAACVCVSLLTDRLIREDWLLRKVDRVVVRTRRKEKELSLEDLEKMLALKKARLEAYRRETEQTKP